MHSMTPVPERRLLRIRGRARAGSEKPVPPRIQAYLRGDACPAESIGGNGDPTNDERRRFSRVSLPAEIVVRRIGGFNFQVALKDISSGGCRVEMIEPCGLGDSLIARLPELEPLGSRVCWAAGAVTGVQFLRPIHPAVFDALLARLPTSESTPE